MVRQPNKSVEGDLKDAFDDLYTRFLCTCPKEELVSSNRFLFVVERAHWFYIDFMRPMNPALPELKEKQFFNMLLTHSGLLKNGSVLNSKFAQWKTYRGKVPVCGCILINKKYTKILLAKNKHNRCWSFPCGKVNKSESFVDCAVREVHEEVGIDVSSMINQKHDIPARANGRDFHFFVIPHVSEKIEVQASSAEEIEEIAWQPLKFLWKSKMLSSHKREILNYIAKFKKADKLKSKQSKNGLPEEPILVEDMDTFDSENELTEDNPLLGEDGTILIDGEEEEGEEEEDEEAEHQDELEQNFLNFRFSDEVY
eukprot:CAMPEP_0206194068 /NCGR_PEP_ID=MMETSP0166-20121206/6969_1 /ASSEMBLY_ACC=CAM_ASM_000260 /TAXON_ID=95228 /ORGANISM="Vannella robusta, Strain DIVA3 518/3/11/1/6" /LENGTH=311 /DNA_ID=CAMNT_0053610955 /DNA_START=187 /DNA_END=1119 /DNA_ORIENTATION=+